MADRLHDQETGTLIRRYREAAGLTQRELGRLVGLSEPAIRNFELGNRSCKTEYLERIAMALRIDPAALGVAYSPDTPSKAMHVLFEIARSYGLRPEVLDDGTIALLMDSPRRDESLASGVVRWAEAERQAARGEISAEELDLWKAGYPRGTHDATDGGPSYSSAAAEAKKYLEDGRK